MALGAPIAGRRLQVRLHGAPLFSGELPPDGDARTALGEAILGAAADLLSLDTVQEAVLSLQRQVPALVRETVPRRIDLGRLTAILRRLLAQRVWPVDVRAVLETVATLPRLEPELDALTEQVRGGLGRFLVKGLLRGSGDVSTGGAAAEGLPALLLSSEIEELLREARRSDGEPGLFLEPELARDIVEGVQSGKKMAPEAVLLCHADVRRSVEELLAGAPGAPPVLAYSEVPASVPVVVLGRVEPGADARASSDERTTPFIDSAAVPWQMRSPKVGRL
jgi:flagellar biosynthesis protein FlhA